MVERHGLVVPTVNDQRWSLYPLKIFSHAAHSVQFKQCHNGIALGYLSLPLRKLSCHLFRIEKEHVGQHS